MLLLIIYCLTQIESVDSDMEIEEDLAEEKFADTRKNIFEKAYEKVIVTNFIHMIPTQLKLIILAITCVLAIWKLITAS